MSYWAALTLSGKVHTSRGAVDFAQERLPRTGRAFEARAWLAGPEQGRMVVEASSRSAEGKPLGALRTRWQPASRAAVARAGLQVPGYLLAEMDP